MVTIGIKTVVGSSEVRGYSDLFKGKCSLVPRECDT